MMLQILLLMSTLPGFQTQSRNDWEPAPFLQDGSTLYACAGDSVKFAWRLNSQGSLRTVRDIKFLHQTEANFMKFNFSNPDRIAFIDIPENKPEAVLTSQEEKYLGRVEVNDRVMTIRGLRVTDSGMYSIVVTGQDRATGAQRVVTSTVTLVVADDIMTTDKGLHISASDTAFFNEATGRHHKVLECGQFTYNTTPPFDVAWTVPGRGLTRSTAYRISNGRFRLVLPVPLHTGSYGCSVTKDNAARACAKQLVQDRINLDATETRFWLQEKDLARVIDTHASEISALETRQQSKLNSLETRLKAKHDSELKSLETRQKSNLASKLNSMKAKHASELNSLETRLNARHSRELNSLEIKLNTLETKLRQESSVSLNSIKYRVRVLEQFKVKASRRIAFWATGLSAEVSGIEVIKFNEIQLNDGGGYSSSTGVFTAPQDGLYVFVATLQHYGKDYTGMFYQLEVNEEKKLGYYSQYAKGDYENFVIGPATAVLRLNKNDKVRIRKVGGTGHVQGNDHGGNGNSFGGVLIAPY